MDEAQATKDGPLSARAEFCPCTKCLRGLYDSCMLKSEHGRLRPYKVPRVSGGASSKPQLVALQEWADSLRAGQIVVFTAAAVDVHMEGVYWLARLLDVAFPATAAMAHASDEIEEGWLVVRAQWYQYVPDAKHPKGWRGYELLPEERLLVIGSTSMVRLAGVKFESEPKRVLRAGAAPRAGAYVEGGAARGRAGGRVEGGRAHGGGRARGAAGGRGRGVGGGRAGRGGAIEGGRGSGAQTRQELSFLGVDTHNLILGCVRTAES